MKIVHVITGLGRGGAESMLVRLLPRLESRQFSNHVVSVMPGGALTAQFRQAGIPVTTLGVTNPLLAVAGLWRLIRLLRAESPAIVQSWLYHADLLATLATRFSGGLLAWNLRCSDMDLGQYSLQSRLVRRLLVGLSKLPEAVIVNSATGQAFHEALGYRPRRWALLPNGIDTRAFHADAAVRQAWRHKHDIDPEAPLVGHIARYDPMKDHAGFVSAAAQLRETLPDVRFVMSGPGVDHANTTLLRQIRAAGLEDAVLLMGELEEVGLVLSSVDVYVQSSAFGEGFPNVVAEAMACAVPCVVTDVGDAAWLVGDSGRAVPPRDPAALAEAMATVLELPAARRRQLGDAARARVVAEFDIDTVAQRYAQLYMELAAG